MPVLTSVVLHLISLGLTVGPELIAAAQTEISLVTGSSPATAEQAAAIAAALDAAHAALQAAEPSV